MTELSEEVFAIESGTEYRMEFTPQSRWDCGISALYRGGARCALRLNIRFDSTENSLDITVRDARGAEITPDALRADDCLREDIRGGVRFRGRDGIPRIKGEISCTVPQGTYYIGFGHGTRAGAEGSGEMIFSVSILK